MLTVNGAELTYTSSWVWLNFMEKVKDIEILKPDVQAETNVPIILVKELWEMKQGMQGSW